MVSRSVQFGVGAAAQCAAVGLMHTPVRADTLHVAASLHIPDSRRTVVKEAQQ